MLLLISRGLPTQRCHLLLTRRRVGDNALLCCCYFCCIFTIILAAVADDTIVVGPSSGRRCLCSLCQEDLWQFSLAHFVVLNNNLWHHQTSHFAMSTRCSWVVSVIAFAAWRLARGGRPCRCDHVMVVGDSEPVTAFDSRMLRLREFRNRASFLQTSRYRWISSINVVRLPLLLLLILLLLLRWLLLLCRRYYHCWSHHHFWNRRRCLLFDWALLHLIVIVIVIFCLRSWDSGR